MLTLLRMPCAILPSVMFPTADTRILSPVAFLTASEKGTWYAGPDLIFCAGLIPLDEMSMRSTPCSARTPASLTVSSKRHDGSSGSTSSSHSVAVTLRWTNVSKVCSSLEAKNQFGRTG